MSAKLALIIGNTDYLDPGLARLSAPGKDTEDFARVLKDPEFCAFDDVKVLLNEPEPVVREAIDDFFHERKLDDLLVLYFSGHGVRDEMGALYLAVKNTNRFRLRSTAIKSDFVREAMDQSRSRRQVLILDCCNSGAFSQGTKAATGVSIGTATAFEAGSGRIILTASDATQYAWEGEQVIGETQNSLFTHFLVQGLEGEADLDGDGNIAVDELYDFAYEKVKMATPQQTPSKFSSKQQGEIILREHIRPEDILPVSLPSDLLDEIDDTRPYVREAAVQKLDKIVRGKNIALARSAREALEKIAADDNTTRRVSLMATQVLEPIRESERAELARKAEEARLAREKAIAEERAKQEAEHLEAEQKAKAERKVQREAKRRATSKAKEGPLALENPEAERQTAERKTRPKVKPVPVAPASGASVTEAPLKKAQPIVPPRFLYIGLAVAFLLGLALLARSLQNAIPRTTAVPSETQVQAVGINTQRPATNTAPVAPPTRTITIAPSPASTASAETSGAIPVTGTSVSIASSRAYLYKGPDQAFGLAVQMAYPRGDKFTVLGRNSSGSWLLCEDSHGNRGWLYRGWLDVDFDPQVIPTASFIPVLVPTERPGGGGGRPGSTQPSCVFCTP